VRRRCHRIENRVVYVVLVCKLDRIVSRLVVTVDLLLLVYAFAETILRVVAARRHEVPSIITSRLHLCMIIDNLTSEVITSVLLGRDVRLQPAVSVGRIYSRFFRKVLFCLVDLVCCGWSLVPFETISRSLGCSCEFKSLLADVVRGPWV
jgi:hypothetical protein